MYRGEADWPIGEVEYNPRIKMIIGNGDIRCRKSMLPFNRYGVDAIMVGRPRWEAMDFQGYKALP
ncbi:MAG: hypothetical protein R2744_09895 [Bacteroidales bacterium]